MIDQKFSDLSCAEQKLYVETQFNFQEDSGWSDNDGNFLGRNHDDVIAALLDFEEAEIAAIGDCMSGCSMITPKLIDFIRKS